VHLESMTIIVQQDVTIYSLLYYCELMFCGGNSTHHQEHISVITASDTGHSNGFTIVEIIRDGLTSAGCCNYNYMCSW